MQYPGQVGSITKGDVAKFDARLQGRYGRLAHRRGGGQRLRQCVQVGVIAVKEAALMQIGQGGSDCHQGSLDQRYGRQVEGDVAWNNQLGS